MAKNADFLQYLPIQEALEIVRSNWKCSSDITYMLINVIYYDARNYQKHPEPE